MQRNVDKSYEIEIFRESLNHQYQYITTYSDEKLPSHNVISQCNVVPKEAKKKWFNAAINNSDVRLSLRSVRTLQSLEQINYATTLISAPYPEALPASSSVQLI